MRSWQLQSFLQLRYKRQKYRRRVFDVFSIVLLRWLATRLNAVFRRGENPVKEEEEVEEERIFVLVSNLKLGLG